MPEILILATGGTIDKLYFDALSEYQIGDSVVDRLLGTGVRRSDQRLIGIL